MDDLRFSQVDFDPFADGEILKTAPSTESQKEIWLSIQIGGDNANCAYNESVVLTVDGVIDADIMKQTLKEVVGRHDALRTTLSPDGSTLSISNRSDYDFPFIDLSECTASERESKISTILDKEVTVPFDLEHGPLFQAKILKTAPAEFKLVITGHHIVLDGWSIAVVIEDINTIYSAHANRKSLSMKPADAFSAYALSLKDDQADAGNMKNEAYWVDLFKDKVPVLDIPTSFTRPPRRSFKAESRLLLLDKTTISSLKKFSAGAKTSLTVVLLAGFKILLHRLAGQEDIVVGIPAADQAVTGLHNLVGHCVNTLPLKSHVSGNMAVMDFIRQVKGDMLSAYDHQRFTYGSLLKKIKVSRDLSRAPLVSILFNIDPGMKALNINGMKASVKTNLRKFENFDMFLNGTESDGQIFLECLYSSDIFDDTSMGWRLDEYKTILMAMMADPNALIRDLVIIPQPEYDLQVKAWNKTDRAYDRNACLHDMFLAAARDHAESVAVEFGDSAITYAELEKRSAVLAGQLKSMGVKPGVLVGIYMERCADMVVALLGILRAGGAYVPIDPEYPRERIEYMVGNAAVGIVVTQSHRDKDVIGEAIRRVCVDTLNVNSAAETTPPVGWNPPTPEDLAYVIYTSGSTGKPKGVKVPHRALVNFMTTMKETPGMSNDDVLLAVTTLSFDIAGLELFLPLVTGAKVHMVSRETAMDGSSLTQLLETAGITMMQATPSTWRIMIEAGWKGTPILKALCGGEPLPLELARELVPRCKSLWNMYGPTETTIWSTCYPITNVDGPILVGRPIANTQIYILDERLKPVPVGVTGEIYIGGDGVTHGYMNLAEQTAKAFLPNPFRPESSGAMMYKTGDLGRYLPDGDIEHCGRIDNQVKVRGFRIELGEIENTLATHTGVKQAICVVKEFSAGDTRIAAYMVLENGGEPDDLEMKDYLGGKLPAYMIPQHFLGIDELPLTPAGKIDRKKLQADLEIGGDQTLTEYAAPETPTEIRVAGIWKDILKLDRIGKHDNFFNIGGHSLLAARVISRLNKEFNLVIKLGELFQRPTIEGLAFKIDGMKGNSGDSESREVFEF